MLQQTQVARVIPVWTAFLDAVSDADRVRGGAARRRRHRVGAAWVTTAAPSTCTGARPRSRSITTARCRAICRAREAAGHRSVHGARRARVRVRTTASAWSTSTRRASTPVSPGARSTASEVQRRRRRRDPATRPVVVEPSRARSRRDRLHRSARRDCGTCPLTHDCGWRRVGNVDPDPVARQRRHSRTPVALRRIRPSRSRPIGRRVAARTGRRNAQQPRSGHGMARRSRAVDSGRDERGG